MKKLLMSLMAVVLFVGISSPTISMAKVMWDKIEVQAGMTGKIVVKKDTDLWKKNTSGKMIKSGKVEKGNVYQVFKYSNPFYSLETGLFIKKSSSIQYTAVPTNLVLNLQLEKTPKNKKMVWGKVEIKKGTIGKVLIQKDTTLWKKDKKNKLIKVKVLKKGTEIRVYSYASNLYKTDSGQYIKKSSSVRYIKLTVEIISDLQKNMSQPNDVLDVISID